MKHIDYEKIAKDSMTLIEQLGSYKSIYAIPRGGVPLGIILSFKLQIPLVEKPEAGTLIVDDLIDSGKTIEPFIESGYDVAVLYRKPHSPEYENLHTVETIDDWIEFSYEKTQTDMEDNVRRLLEYMGEDPTREGLLDTPKRYLKFMREFMDSPDFNFTTFDSEGYDQMIIQKNIPFFSLCEHHIAPFFGYATVAYIPSDRIVGLSKLTRTVETYARRLQNQERITNEVAQRIQKELNPVGVAVSLEARHFCMEMRGVRTHDVSTKTTKLIGAFKEEQATRQEFMSL